MEPKEIKKQVDGLFSIVEFLLSQKTDAKIKISQYENQIKNVHNLILEVRRKCHHTYIGKKSTYMGRGTCEICGDSDY